MQMQMLLKSHANKTPWATGSQPTSPPALTSCPILRGLVLPPHRPHAVSQVHVRDVCHLRHKYLSTVHGRLGSDVRARVDVKSGLAWPGLWPRLDIDTVQFEPCGLYELRWNTGGSDQDLLN